MKPHLLAACAIFALFTLTQVGLARSETSDVTSPRESPGTESPGPESSGVDLNAIVPARLASDLAAVCSYPDEALKANEKGVTQLSVSIDTAGAATSVALESSSGSERLDSAALACGPKLRFTPATRAGQPVPFTGVIKVVWSGYRPLAKTCDRPSSAEFSDFRVRYVMDPSLIAQIDRERAKPAAEVDGQAVACVCIDESGKLTAEPNIMESSANARLDAVALGIAKGLPHHAGTGGCIRITFDFTRTK
jgi:TonB family protein